MSQQEVVLQPYQWDYYEVTRERSSIGVLNCWALNRDSEPCLAKFEPLFHTDVKLPRRFCEDDNAEKYGKRPTMVPSQEIIWTDELISNLYLQIIKLVSDYQNASTKKGINPAPVKYTIELRKRLYYYNDNKEKFLRLYFTSLSTTHFTAGRISRSFWPGFGDKSWRIKCECYGHDVTYNKKLEEVQLGPTTLTYYAHLIALYQFTTELNIQPSDWFNAQAFLIPPEYCQSVLREREYFIPYQSIKAVPEIESSLWETYPLVMAFDIETYCANHRAFPNAFNHSDIIFMVSCIFQILNKPETRMNIVILLGECNPIPGVEIIKVKTEEELCNQFIGLINKYSPTVITSFNGLGFDYKYMDTKYTCKYGLNWPAAGRIFGQSPGHGKAIWKSSAFGNIDLLWLDFPGIINIDMYCIIKRDVKLRSYGLDYVSKHFLEKGKHPVKPVEMNQIVQANIEMCNREGILNIDINNPCIVPAPQIERKVGGVPEEVEIIDAESSDDDTDEGGEKGAEGDDADGGGAGEKEQREKERKESGVSKHGEGQAVEDDGKLSCDKRLDLSTKEKILEQSTRFVLYCVQDAVLTIELYEYFKDWTGRHEQSNAFMVTMTDTWTRGQQVKVLAWVYKMAEKHGFVMTTRQAPFYDFKGGLVQEPITGLTKKVHCYDANSLYPSLIRERNICFTTLIPPEQTLNIKTGDTADYNEVVCQSADKVERIFHYSKKCEGILPIICGELIRRRSAVKKLEESTGELIDKLVFEKIIELLTVEFGNDIDKEGLTKAVEKDQEKKLLEFNEVPNVITMRDLYKKMHQKFDKDKTKVYFERATKVLGESYTKLVSLKALYKQRQTALKLVNNSIFGGLGSKIGGKFTLVEAAMSITAEGQRLIMEVAHFLERTYGARLIYGDTDSVMMQIDTPTGKTDWQFAHEVEVSINKYVDPNNKGIMKFECEKIMNILCLTKKKYAARTIGKDGKVDMSDKGFIVKGAVTARRDICKMQGECYGKELYNIIDEKSIYETSQMIEQVMYDLYSGKTHWADLLISKSVGSNYKNPAAQMKVFSEESAKRGKPILAGERVEFVYVIPKDDPNVSQAGKRMRLLESYMEECEMGIQEPIDKDRYVEKVFQNNIQKLFNIGYEKQLKELYEKRYKKVDYTNACLYLVGLIELRKFRFQCKDKQTMLYTQLAGYPYLQNYVQYLYNQKKKLDKEVIVEIVEKYIKRFEFSRIASCYPGPVEAYTALCYHPSITEDDVKVAQNRYIFHKSRIQGDRDITRIDEKLVHTCFLLHKKHRLIMNQFKAVVMSGVYPLQRHVIPWERRMSEVVVIVP